MGKLKEKVWKNISQVNINQRKAVVAMLTSDKIDFRAKKNTTEREGHYIMIKRPIHQEDTVILNVCTEQLSCKICETTVELNGEINLHL